MANWRVTSKALLVAAFKDRSNFEDGCSSILVVAAGSVFVEGECARPQSQEGWALRLQSGEMDLLFAS
uniref:Uncharacterized protein n=1 Tax=Romanomermis culicivorax TaxID=13658 RepID=A0A915JSP5_ROMCU